MKKSGLITPLIATMLLIFVFYSTEIAGQSSVEPHETVGDGYTPVNRSGMQRGAAYRYQTPVFSVVQVNVDESGNNIIGDASNEPSIAVNPTNPQEMVIGWRHFETIQSNFRQAGMAYTTDGGETWTFPGVLDPGIFRSDPVLVAGSDGTVYYNSLTVEGNSDYLCHVFRSEDGGQSWSEPVFAYGGDKQWMTIDRSGGPGNDHLYAYWNASYSVCPPNMFTRSVDQATSWEECISVPGEPYWGTLTVDAEGRLYIGAWSWAGFRVARSFNAQFAGEDIEWDVQGFVNLDGGLVGFGGYQCPNPSGLLGQTIIDVDRSNGPYFNNVYMLASVERYSVNDPCDVMFSRSTDGGVSWSEPVRVNDDPGTNAWQWFGTMSVAPNGRIDVVWLDTRDNPGGVNSRLYYSWSEDAGETWSPNMALSESFNPHLGWPQQDKMGDYFDMVSDENGAHLAWAATFNVEQDVYYSRILFPTTGIKPSGVQPNLLGQNYPNPFSGTTTFRYSVKNYDDVRFTIINSAGQEVYQESCKARPGSNAATFDLGFLPGGIYTCRLETTDGTFYRKMIRSAD